MWLAVVLAFSQAQAEPLAWEWPEDASRRYITAAYFQSPYVITLIEGSSGYVRAAQVGIKAVINCRVDSPLPKNRGWFIECAIEDGSIWAVPVMEDQGRAASVVHDYEAWMEKSTLAFKLGTDGRLSQPRLEVDGAENPDDRYIMLTLERMLSRAISSLDVALDDPAEGEWPLRSSQATAFPLSGVMSQFKGRVYVEEPLDGDQMLSVKFKGGYGYGDDSYKGEGLQRVRFGDDSVREARVELYAGSNSNEAAGIVPYRLIAWTQEVASDEEIALDASQGW